METPARTLPDATPLGSVHLTVAALGTALRFYRDVLGLTVIHRSGDRITRLRYFTVLLPDRAAATAVRQRLVASGAPLDDGEGPGDG